MTLDQDKVVKGDNGGEADCDTPSESQPSSTPSSSSDSSSVSIPHSSVLVLGSPKNSEGTVIEEVMTAVVGKKQSVRGQAFRAVNGVYVSYLCKDDNIFYHPGGMPMFDFLKVVLDIHHVDSVYIESKHADQPFLVCSILKFRKSKRDTLMVNIKWFYRPSEVPETVYQRLAQDRNTENNNKSLVTDDPVIKSRELFISDATDTYPVSVLRGLCRVDHYSDIHSVRDFNPEDNSFFYILQYDPQTKELTSITRGEIRVGPSYQAELPEYRGNVVVDERPEVCAEWEEQRWVPGASLDTDLLMYLRAARSMAAFAGLCDGGSTTDGCNAASRDDTTINALEMLHNSDYDHGKALQALVKCPVPDGIEKKWSEDERKRFKKGLRKYGKDFFQIRKNLLPHKKTGELVSFYYLWKKTPAAASYFSHNCHSSKFLRQIRTPRAPLTTSSVSEKDNDSDDSDYKDQQDYCCLHCYTTSSSDWYQIGKDKRLLCYECHVHFKRSKEISTRHWVARQSRANILDIMEECPTPDRWTQDARTARYSASPAPKNVRQENVLQVNEAVMSPEVEAD
ncbi:hypothetical protein Pmani_027412 [Petrolisthes manimaculis]|uniref:Uncharacterized protein n=1 Tax=Petrolisthes manimaculis TaxID=1843537 RepID=A0AAE1P1N8_9EUCA|nr:hypothetical protein Pmani_027412 [Petrolisthes manimaculis]